MLAENVAEYRRGEIASALPCRDRAAQRGRRDVHHVRQHHGRDPRAGEDRGKVFPLDGEELLRVGFRSAEGADACVFYDLLRLMPRLKRQEHIRPHKEPQLVAGICFVQLPHRIRGIALALPQHLHVGDLDLDAGLQCDLLAHEARHGKAVLLRRRPLRERLVRRNPGGDEQQFIKF